MGLLMAYKLNQKLAVEGMMAVLLGCEELVDADTDVAPDDIVVAALGMH